MTEPLVTAREVANHLGMTPRQVLARFERGDIPGFRLGKAGAPVRFRISEIEAWLDAQRIGPRPQTENEAA